MLRTSRSQTALVSLLILTASTACTDLGAPEEDGAFTGELVVHFADFPDHSETRYALRQGSGVLRDLAVTSDPALPAGARVKVWGTDQRDAIRVARMERARGDVGSFAAAIVDATPNPVRHWAFVLVDVGGGVTLTSDAAKQRIFSGPTSIRSHYQQDSYGMQDLSGDVFGPLPATVTTCADDEMDTLARDLRPMIPGTYDQYLWFFGKKVATCDWSGLASGGSAVRPAKDSWFNGSTDCGTLVQEPGHNFGMNHSSSLRCTLGSAKVSFITDTEGTCTHSEYGNPFDPMGDGCGHMDAYQKGYESWLPGCNFVKVTASGTFTLFPIETACNGVQALQIPLRTPRRLTLGGGGGTPTITSYYLELRTPVGLDQKVPLGVQVAVADEIRDARRFGGHNWLLDMTPETSAKTDVALPVGRAYADPDPMGPKFTVLSADATKAVISVDLGDGMSARPGAGTCDDGSPFTAPGPEQCAAAPPAPDGGAPPLTRDAGRGADATPRADSRGTNDVGAAAPEQDGGGRADSARPGSEGEADTGPGPTGAGGKAGGGQTGGAVRGGCGCRLAAGPESPLSAPALAVVLAVLRRRRRRARR
jgi:MYXO-CTERM domain-containing protein